MSRRGGPGALGPLERDNLSTRHLRVLSPDEDELRNPCQSSCVQAGGETIVHGLRNAVCGAVGAVCHPIQTGRTVGDFLVGAYQDPVSTAAALTSKLHSRPSSPKHAVDAVLLACTMAVGCSGNGLYPHTTHVCTQIKTHAHACTLTYLHTLHAYMYGSVLFCSSL